MVSAVDENLDMINSDFVMNRDLNKGFIHQNRLSWLETLPRCIKISFFNVIIFEASHFGLTLKLFLPTLMLDVNKFHKTLACVSFGQKSILWQSCLKFVLNGLHKKLQKRLENCPEDDTFVCWHWFSGSLSKGYTMRTTECWWNLSYS